MIFYCYILYSEKINRYYIGETQDINQRLILHNSGFFKKSYTSKTSDWEIYYLFKCNSRKQARAIEKHIKKMKSRKYIENLNLYPEICQKLLLQYK